LREYIATEGYHVEGKARVVLRTNPDLRKGKFDIESRTVTPDAVVEPSSTVGAVGSVPLPPRNLGTVAETPEEKTGAMWADSSSHDAPPAVLTLPGGQRIELHEGHYVLGRHLENDIVLNDTNVSRKHAEFVCAAGEVMVRDLGSTNGTKVNGVLVGGEQLLQHGDVINFGTAQVTFEAS
jgi:hypothetical protein